MLAFAAHEIALQAHQSDGLPLRAHLESIERQTGKTPDELLPVDCPSEVAYLWEYFLSMNARRTIGPAGVNAITHEGIDAWARLRGIDLLPLEIAALDALEALYLSLQVRK